MNNNIIVGSEVLTAVVMKINICWDVTPCSSMKINQRSGGMSASSSGSKNKPSKKPARSRQEATCWFLAWFILQC
jgi:hypothetical protein